MVSSSVVAAQEIAVSAQEATKAHGGISLSVPAETTMRAGTVVTIEVQVASYDRSSDSLSVEAKPTKGLLARSSVRRTVRAVPRGVSKNFTFRFFAAQAGSYPVHFFVTRQSGGRKESLTRGTMVTVEKPR